MLKNIILFLQTCVLIFFSIYLSRTELFFTFDNIAANYALVGGVAWVCTVVFGYFLVLAISLIGIFLINKQFKNMQNTKNIDNEQIAPTITFGVTETSDETACIFKDTKIPEWIKIEENDEKFFFDRTLQTDTLGNYIILPGTPDGMILKPGALFVMNKKDEDSNVY